jgi:hypothetical protein
LLGRRLAAKQESYSWLFVDTIPLLYKEKNIERQNKVETWLDLYQLTRELNLSYPEKRHDENPPINYVI